MNLAGTALGRFGRCIGKPPGYERVVRALMPPARIPHATEIMLRVEGVTFVTRPAVPLDWNLFFFGTYEPEVRRLIRRVLRAGCVAVDVGANIGWHTALMATRAGESGRVLAFEPNASLRQRLRRNLALNRLAGVEVLPYAVYDRACTLRFDAPPADDAESGNGRVLGVGGTEGVAVEARTLDAMADEARIARLDFIKIDVEGYEWPVLQGARGAITRFRPHIVFEHNEEYVARGGGSAIDMHDYFAGLGYSLFALGRHSPQPIHRGGWPSNANVWASPGGRADG